MKHTYLLIFILAILSSCGNEVGDPDDSLLGSEYFPLSVGNEWVYQVDSLFLISGGSTVIETSSYVRDVITEKIDESENRYRLERSGSQNPDGPWRLTDVWTISSDEQGAYRTEENIKFLKLVFPFKNGTKWDGNVFFDSDRTVQVGPDYFELYENWEYIIDDTNLSREYNGSLIEDVIRVEHVDYDDNFILAVSSDEYYAKGIGLVEWNQSSFTSENGKPPGPWNENGDSGFEISQKLVSSIIK